MLDFFVNLALFVVILFALPLVFIIFVVLKLYRRVWTNVLSMLHPDVEFVKYDTVRSLLDTYKNQGIIAVLLCVKGQAQPDAVRRHLQEVVRRRDKSGNLAFPRLRHCLLTKCGTYAWRNTKFDLDQHLTLLPFTYKGRVVTELNIQDYVNDIMSKYMPSTIPPWQITIIPSSDDQHYILFKLHHLLLSEGLNIGDLLPLIPPTRPAIGSTVSRSPLVEVFKKPVVLPQLKERLTEELSNRWNEFIACYDPLERPELLKTSPTFSQFLAFALITLVSLVKDCRKGFRVIKNDAYSKVKYVVQAGLRETDKRQVTVTNFFVSICKSLDPRNIALDVFQLIYYVVVKVPIRLPLVVFYEVRAFLNCLILGYCPYPNTFVGIVYTFIPLIYNSLREILYILSILFRAPKTIIQDILMQEESFQTFTLCGRKSVAWSDPVKIDAVRAVATLAKVSQTEIMLCAVSMCLSKYFVQSNHYVPDQLPITIRNISSNYIFATGPNIKASDAVSGILCMNLKVPNGRRDATKSHDLDDVCGKFNASLESQGLSHLMTMLQSKFEFLTKLFPLPILSVYLKYLSRKYAVSVAEITSKYPNVAQRTLWGQEVTSALYLRPPQANTCVSLCLNEYADHVRLGVMCDSQLVPHHQHLVRSFADDVKEIEADVVERLDLVE
ncbi:unnamed protein product [Phyllotreta striolata]|uniref:O-acyltransferase WSD1 C-terminal domain-containing protein n=1 Tax=Phyllotreta striolata TaxID=444603 RepID=A0A9N9XS83_PHYSR|nr:unnamed protein product [Phyllotreta striolata]